MEWRDVPGYEGVYAVSNAGLVKSLERQIPNRWGTHSPLKERILKPATDRDGYQRVVLCAEGAKRGVPVHALVLEAFVGPRPDDKQAGHRNGDPSDNRPENLYWATVSENANDRIRHGTMPRGENHARSKLSNEKVRWIRENQGDISHGQMAERLGVSAGSIYAVLNGLVWRHVD